MNYVCERCGIEVGPSEPGVAYEVVGWEKPRPHGGTNHLSRRRRTGRAMCPACQTEPEPPSLFTM